MAEVKNARRHACGFLGFVPLESSCNCIHQKALLGNIQGTGFDIVKINNAKIKGYEHVTLKVEKYTQSTPYLNKFDGKSIY